MKPVVRDRFTALNVHVDLAKRGNFRKRDCLSAILGL